MIYICTIDYSLDFCMYRLLQYPFDILNMPNAHDVFVNWSGKFIGLLRFEIHI